MINKVKLVHEFMPVTKDTTATLNSPCTSNVPELFTISDDDKSLLQLSAKVKKANEAMQSYSTIQKRLSKHSQPKSIFERLRLKFA